MAMMKEFKNTLTSRIAPFNAFVPNTIICAILGLMPCFGRLDAGKRFSGDTLTENLIFWLTYVMTFFQFMSGYVGIFLLFRDYDRISFSNNQVNQMLSVRKDTFSLDKLFPTYNFTNRNVLNSWMMTRKVVNDYGIRFYSRHMLLIQVFFVLFVANFILSLYIDFVFIGMTNDDIIPLQYVLISLTTFFGVSVVLAMKRAQEVNRSMSESISVMQANLTILNEVANNFEFYSNVNTRVTERAHFIVAKAIASETQKDNG